MFRAVLLSRSCTAAQLGHGQSRIDRFLLPSCRRQVEPLRLPGSHRLITTCPLLHQPLGEGFQGLAGDEGCAGGRGEGFPSWMGHEPVGMQHTPQRQGKILHGDSVR